MGIHIDPDFRDLLPPMSNEAHEQLKESILEEGCRDPLVVWEHDNKMTLLDGHNRHAICTANGIPYETVAKSSAEIPDRDAAMDWILHNQLTRRNLTPDQFALYMGRLRNRLKQQGVQTDLTCGHNDHKLNHERTADQLVKEHGRSEKTVRRMGEFAKAVDILKKTDPTIEQRIAKGEALSRAAVIAEADSDVVEINRLHQEILDKLYASLVEAIKADGLLTTQVKASMSDEEFSSFIEEKLDFDGRAAQKLMELYENRGQFGDKEDLDVEKVFMLLLDIVGSGLGQDDSILEA